MKLMVELKVEKLENQIETIVDMVEENKNLRNKVDHLKHLRRMDLEFLGILVWGYGLDKHKYDAMDKRIYSGYSTYKHPSAVIMELILKNLLIMK